MADRVVAVEIDPVLAAELPTTVRERARPGTSFDVVLADAVQVAELPGPAPTALVANLPYNVAVPVLLTMLQRFDSLQHGVVMVQSEVADRLVAGPGSRTYGVPSVKTAWYAQARRAGSVPPPVFWPVPRVDSGLVAFTRRPARRRPRRAKRSSPSSTPPSPSAARRCGPPWRRGRVAGPGRGGAPRGGRRPADAGGAAHGRRLRPDRRGGTLGSIPVSPTAPTSNRPGVTARAPAKVNLLLQVGPSATTGSTTS